MTFRGFPSRESCITQWLQTVNANTNLRSVRLNQPPVLVPGALGKAAVTKGANVQGCPAVKDHSDTHRPVTGPMANPWRLTPVVKMKPLG